MFNSDNNEKLLNNVKAVIFDLDGTLIDTEIIYSKIWPVALKDMGIEMKWEHYLSMRSLGRPYAPKKMKEWYGEDFDYDKARRIRKTYFDAYIKEHGIEKKPGAIELLNYLRDLGITTAIATATDIERATEYLKITGLEGYFDRVISATMVDEGKPSPKVYEYAVRELALSPEECVAVEDAPNGILSAYRAGLKVIMVPDITGPEEYFADCLFAYVDTLDGICKIIR